jgi:uncharacterized membrane protein HdeD (DUF308 family)
MDTTVSAGLVTAVFGMPLDEVRKHSKMIFWEGVLFVVFGLFAIAVPWAANIAVEWVVGVLLIVSGFLQFFRCWKSRKASWFFLELLGGVLAIVAGFLILTNPFKGALALTLLLAIFFMVEGVFKLGVALQMRAVKYSGWLGFDGLLCLALAALILMDWPYSAQFFLGLYLGVYLIMFGNALIVISLGLKRDCDAYA